MQEPDCTEDLPERITLHVWPGQGRFELREGESDCLVTEISHDGSAVRIPPPPRAVKYSVVRHANETEVRKK